MSSLRKYKKIKYLGKGSYGAAILVELKSDPSQTFVIKEIVIGISSNHGRFGRIVTILSYQGISKNLSNKLRRMKQKFCTRWHIPT
jgi:hypothetical protein